MKETAAATEANQAQCKPYRHLCTANLRPSKVPVSATTKTTLQKRPHRGMHLLPAFPPKLARVCRFFKLLSHCQQTSMPFFFWCVVFDITEPKNRLVYSRKRHGGQWLHLFYIFTYSVSIKLSAD